MRRFLFVAAAAALLAACEKPAIGCAATDNPNLVVSHLVTIDGCRVYRFEDGGNNRYLTACPGGSVSASHSESCGKGCTRTRVEEIQTVTPR
jgi:hypothetical protein